ncbi:hypothetical protein PsalMR5_01810 [Piscirickettsia salmonis]|nr:hypothetical protein PsalSR1_02305 [Piscirickettsia salmonis]QGP63946.1 hypothetical protein PsalMR5_01810 [Piscirickettsia salmonis]
MSKDGQNWESIYFANKVIMPMWRFRVISLLREAYNHENFIMPDECRDQFPDYASYNRLLNNEYQKYWRKRRYLGRYFAHPMMQNRRAKRDDYKPSAVRVTQRCVP